MTMEIRPKLERLDGCWRYSCDRSAGVGATPEEAYVQYLKNFEYRGPTLGAAACEDHDNADDE